MHSKYPHKTTEIKNSCKTAHSRSTPTSNIYFDHLTTCQKASVQPPKKGLRSTQIYLTAVKLWYISHLATEVWFIYSSLALALAALRRGWCPPS